MKGLTITVQYFPLYWLFFLFCAWSCSCEVTSTVKTFDVVKFANVNAIASTLVGGTCNMYTPQITNLALIGDIKQAGLFTGGDLTKTLQLSPTGVVFSSGFASTAVSPNSNDDQLSLPGNLAIPNSYDASGVTMTLTWPSLPAGTYNFEGSFVFASAEYDVSSGRSGNYNDGIAILIDGYNCAALLQGLSVSVIAQPTSF